MASKVLLVVLFIFDVVAFALAVAAYRWRAQAVHGCTYNTDLSNDLGAGSFLCLMVSQLVVMAATRFLFCGSKALAPGHYRTCTILLFITSWVTFFITGVCLLAGTVRENLPFGGKFEACDDQPMSAGVYGAGAAFVVFTAIISELYYFCYSKTIDDDFEPLYTQTLQA